jgi:hypothetical protein
VSRSPGGVHAYDPTPASIPSEAVVLSPKTVSWAQ